MEIDDILASVDAQDDDSVEQQQKFRDLQALTRAWVAERAAPELMPYPYDLMERVMGRIQRQIALIETETGNVDPKANFRLIIIQTELERFKFLVRSFLRARIAKIDKHPLHLLSLSSSSSSTSTTHPILSPSELRYLTQHQTLLHRHYLNSFLGGFPEQLRRLDDTAGGISMIDKPDLDTAVFVRALKDVDLQGRAGAMTGDGEGLERGGIYVLRYSLVQEEVRRGDVELI